MHRLTSRDQTKKTAFFSPGLLRSRKPKVTTMDGIGLSEKGVSILKENGVTMDMFKTFTENDIVDIFQGATFADRFQLRQFLFGNNKNSATITPANNTPAKNKQSDLRRFCQPELPSGSAHGSQQSNVELETTATSTPSSSCKRTYNVMDMFRTKERRYLK